MPTPAVIAANLDPVPWDDDTTVEDVLEVRRALLVLNKLESGASSHRVMHKSDGLALLHGASCLAKTVPRPAVTQEGISLRLGLPAVLSYLSLEIALRDEDHDHCRLVDVRLECTYILEVVLPSTSTEAGVMRGKPAFGGAGAPHPRI